VFTVTVSWVMARISGSVSFCAAIMEFYCWQISNDRLPPLSVSREFKTITWHGGKADIKANALCMQISSTAVDPGASKLLSVV